jgi:1-acyl-sn-glycerol-3-phosphate acyltransferase
VADWFYKTVVTAGRFPFWVASRPAVLNAGRVPRTGPFILASNHLSPFDVPVLMRHTPRVLDFVSIVEVFRNPVMAWFFSSMGAFPLDRWRVDVRTTNIILERLRRGRAVAMFPEGRLRAVADSVLTGGTFRPGIIRIARLAGVPVVPVAVWNTGAFARPASWAPVRGTVYGVNYGEPIQVTEDDDGERRLAETFRLLYADLKVALAPREAAPAG